MKRAFATSLKLAALSALAVAAADAVALPLVWRADWPAVRPCEATVHRGTDIELRPNWYINGQPAATNGWSFTTYVTTNADAAAATWFGPLPGPAFSHTNDIGAAFYNVIVRAATPGGEVNYTAFARLRMLDSPGFAPGELPLPTKSLDFAAITVYNAPYYTKAETDAEVAAAATAATNYTDSATNALDASLSSQVSRASRAATNYTDAAVAAIPEADLTPATNYTDSATNALNASLTSQVSRASRDATNYTDAAIAAIPEADLTPATNYTDAATNALDASLSSQVSRASRAATNYTDAAVAAIPEADLTPATNYTDAATNALNASLSSQVSRVSRDATNYTDEAVAAVATAATNYTDEATNAMLGVQAYYPDGSVKSAAELTRGIKYTFNSTTRTASVKPFCDTGDPDGNNSSLAGRVVIPPFVDAQGNPYISDDGTRFKVVGVAGAIESGSTQSMLTAIVAPTTLISIGNYAFDDCYTLTSVSLPAATSIGNYAFYICRGLTSISLPAATNINEGAFGYCDVLTFISLPAATSIGNYAFSGCLSIVSVSLPVATSIGEEALGDCTSLASVDFGGAARSSVPTLGSYAFFNVPNSCKIIVPDSQYDAWKAASGWSDLVTAGYKFLKHSEWEYARRCEVEEKIGVAAHAATNYTDATVGPVASNVERLGQQVAAIGANLNGEDARFVSTNYDSSVTLPAAYVELKIRDEATGSNTWVTIWQEMRRWTAFVGSAFNWQTWQGFHTWATNIAAEISYKADRAWGAYDSETGGYSPEGFTQVSSSNILVGAGMAYQRTVTSGGSVWILQCNSGPATIGGDTNGFFRVMDGDGEVQFEIIKGTRQELGCDATGIAVDDSTSPPVVTIPYSVVADEHPTLRICDDLATHDWKDESDPDCIANVSWSGISGAYVATVQRKTSGTSLFVKATYMTGGETYIRNAAPVGMDSIILNGVKYYLGTATIDGKTVLTLSTTAP